MYYLLLILLVVALFCMIFLHCRRKKIICRIRCMDKCQKCSLLDELVTPFGYTYHCRCGFFSSTVDAWQKDAGYTWLYDYMAPRFQMVFDALPIYFDYQGRTWLIELWKGQYGINTGAELGIYHADHILSETEYKTAFFTAADDIEMLPCTMSLCRKGGECVQLSARHWWLTAFLTGCFSKPSDLCLDVSICFPNEEMFEAFCEGLHRTGYHTDDISSQGLCLRFTFYMPLPEHFGFLTRLHRRLSQCLNRLYCKLYVLITRPFVCTEDRVLYLYYYLPFFFRRWLRLRRFHRHCHKKHGCRPPRHRSIHSDGNNSYRF